MHYTPGQFRLTHSADGRHLELVFPDGMTVDELLEQFRFFMLAVGYVVDGTLVVEDRVDFNTAVIEELSDLDDTETDELIND